MGRWRWAAYGCVGTWLLVSIIIPVITIIWVALIPFFQPPSLRALESVSLSSFFDAFEWIGGPLKNTLILMAGSVIIAASLAISITWLVTRSRHSMAHWADSIVFLAPAVPTIVTGVAFQFLGIAIYHWLPLFGTIWLVAIAMGTRMLAYCTRTMNATSLQIQFELDEAAYVSGVSKLDTFRRIFLPLMAPAIFYLRGVSPPEMKLKTMYQGVIPFVMIQVVALAIVMVYPDLVTWLPDKLLGFENQ